MPVPRPCAFFVPLTLVIAGCSGSTDEQRPEPEAMRVDFGLETPPFALEPGAEQTYCYYTTLGNDRPIAVRRWRSAMTEGSHHMILYRTKVLPRPTGTLEDCGSRGLISGGGISDVDSFPVWTYAAQSPEVQQTMPPGVGQPLDVDQPVIVQMHYLNTFGRELEPTVRVEVEVYDDGAEYTPAGVYMTYNTQIEVPPNSTSSARGSCAVSEEAQFFNMTTHSHRFTTQAKVTDGERLIVQTDDWEHPPVESWRRAPFLSFASGQLDYQCEYFNPTAQTVRTGDSAETDEMCMAVGYFFPSTGFTACVNSFVVVVD
jgi:hypothetical protein